MAKRHLKRTRAAASGRMEAGSTGLDNALLYALCCGSVAGLTSNAGVALAALQEGRSVWQPFNATSHWLHGKSAGKLQSADLAHTVPGAMTNHAASMFWGAVLGTYFALRPPSSNAAIFRDATLLGALALIVDYGLLPRKLSPGWHLVLSRSSVLGGFVAMSVGLGLGGVAAHKLVAARTRR